MGLNYELVMLEKLLYCLPEGVAVAHNSYTMSTCGLPYMYALSPRSGPRAL